MIDQTGASLGRWWREQGRWKWWVVGVVVILGIGAATESHGSSSSSKVPKVTTAMTAQNWDFWERLTQNQRVQVADDCRFQLANRIREASAANPTNIASEVSNLYAEYSESTILTVCEHAIPQVISSQNAEARSRREHQQEEKKEREEENTETTKKTVENDIKHHTFVVTDTSLSQYITSNLIGEHLREVTCHIELQCTVTLDDYAPQKAGKIATFLGLGRSTQEQLLEDPDKVFAAIFADPHMQKATVISWDELETNGGKSVRWPTISVTCDASAAKQIDWERVSSIGVEELCKVTLLPNGPPE